MKNFINWDALQRKERFHICSALFIHPVYRYIHDYQTFLHLFSFAAWFIHFTSSRIKTATMVNNTTVSIAIPSNILLCSLVFKFIAMIIGVLGNVTVVIYTIFSNKEKTATSYLVGNLAFADLLVCLTFYPIWIIEFIQTMLNIDSDQDLFCKFSRSTVWAFTFASIATLLAITVDRYLYIVKPLIKPQVSADCDASTSVSCCFRNLDNCLLPFYCLVYSRQKLWHCVSKFLWYTSQHSLLHWCFCWTSTPFFNILSQLPHFDCCAKTT